MEKWKDIKDYEGLYRISSAGRILSLGRTTVGKNGVKTTHSERFLSLKPNHKGYVKVSLMNRQGITKTRLVHRLVAQAFIPNPENKPQINHKNGIKNDNKIENLEWNTQEENNLHAHLSGLLKPVNGVCHGKVKLTEDQILEICHLLDTTEFSQLYIAGIYEISQGTVSDIKLGKKWNHLTGRGGIITPENIRTMNCKPVINSKGEVFGSASEAAEAYGLKGPGAISKACLGVTPRSAKLTWKYLDKEGY